MTCEIKLSNGDSMRVEVPFADISDALRGRDPVISLMLNGRPVLIRVDQIVSVTDYGEGGGLRI